MKFNMITLLGLSIGASLLLTSCTQIERFNTDKVLSDVTGTNTAKIKVTTNIYNVFAIPNHACITLDEQKVRKVNTPVDRTNFWDFSELFNTSIKEESKKSVGMKEISLNQINELKGVLPNNVKKFYSYEYEVEANKPITFFIKTTQGTDLFSYLALFAKESEEIFGLSVSLIPEKGKEYQLFVTLGESSTLISPTRRRNDYKYSFNLFDITQGTLNYQNNMMTKATVCPK